MFTYHAQKKTGTSVCPSCIFTTYIQVRGFFCEFFHRRCVWLYCSRMEIPQEL